MRSFAVTLTSEDGPFFNVYADDFEITKNTYTHKPYSIIFGIGCDIVATVCYKDVYEIAEIIDDNYVKLEV